MCICVQTYKLRLRFAYCDRYYTTLVRCATKWWSDKVRKVVVLCEIRGHFVNDFSRFGYHTDC